MLPLPLFLPLAGLLGACLGSFYGVCIQRGVQNILAGRQPFSWASLGGRSHCETCGTRLHVWHLVPLISWLVLRGRCGFCGAHLGFFCLGTELISASVALMLGIQYGPTLAFIVMLVIFGALIVASGIDIHCMVLPDSITLPLALCALPTAVFILRLHWMDSLLGGVLGALLLLTVRALYAALRKVEALGLGDVKLMLSLGCLCGITRVPMLLILSGISALTIGGVYTWYRGGKESFSQLRLPFGPFLSLGCLLSVLYGHLMPRWF